MHLLMFLLLCLGGGTAIAESTTTNAVTTVNPVTTAAGRPQKRIVGDAQVFSWSDGKMVQGLTSTEVIAGSSRLQCALRCHGKFWCLSMDYSSDTGECRLFSTNSVSLGNNGTASFGSSGGVANPAYP